MSDEQKQANKERMADYYIGQYRSRVEIPSSAPNDSSATISVTPPKWSDPREISCPNCYGGHFRPCNICGDSGVALFSERMAQPNDKLTDSRPR